MSIPTTSVDFFVTNTGTTMLDSVGVDDPKLAAAGVDVTCPRDALAPGEQMVCLSDPYTITAADESNGSVHNVATATATVPGGDPIISDESQSIVPTTDGASGELPNTGAGFTWWMPLAGLGLLAIGFGLILAKPRRREGHI